MQRKPRGPRVKDWCFTSFQDNLGLTGNETELDYFVAQRERCPDTGREHWQGFCQYKSGVCRSRIQGLISDPVAHCEPRRGSSREASDYCKKNDSRVCNVERIEYGQLIERGNETSTREPAIEDVCRRALGADSREEAIATIEQGAPSLLFRSFFSIQALMRERFPDNTTPFVYKPHWAWNLPTAIADWLRVEYTKCERAKCLILVGPTRLGKTNWARSLGPHMFWRGNVNYGGWNQNARYIVIDDIEWKYIPQKKSILTQMGHITLTDKYVKKLDVFNDKPAIFCTNDMPTIEDGFNEYWHVNTTVVCLNEKLFNEGQLAIQIAN